MVEHYQLIATTDRVAARIFGDGETCYTARRPRHGARLDPLLLSFFHGTRGRAKPLCVFMGGGEREKYPSDDEQQTTDGGNRTQKRHRKAVYVAQTE